MTIRFLTTIMDLLEKDTLLSILSDSVIDSESRRLMFEAIHKLPTTYKHYASFLYSVFNELECEGNLCEGFMNTSDNTESEIFDWYGRKLAQINNVELSLQSPTFYLTQLIDKAKLDFLYDEPNIEILFLHVLMKNNLITQSDYERFLRNGYND